jgi:protein-ribulosamine 3-kinase
VKGWRFSPCTCETVVSPSAALYILSFVSSRSMHVYRFFSRLNMTSLHPLLVRCFQRAGYDASTLNSSLSTIVVDKPSCERFFVKTGRNVAQMRGEAESLKAIANIAPDLVPRVIGFEVDESGKEAGMVSRYFDLSSFRSSGTQTELAKKVAEMHTPPAGVERYGFEVPTHCGMTEQDNTWEEGWMVFFRDRRLGDLVRRIDDAEITSAWEKMKAR